MLNCVAIDDEPLALELIQKYISKIPEINLTASFSNLKTAETYLQEHQVDLIFLDIYMPDMNGVDFYKSLHKKPRLVFTTAYKEYGAEGFEVNAIDYLLKPFSFSRFQKAINKVYYGEKGFYDNDTKETSCIYINAEYKIMKVFLTEIIYIEADNDYIYIHTAEKSIKTHLSLKSIEDRLPSNQFTRIHKKYIVANQHVSYAQYRKIGLGNNISLPVGDKYRQPVNTILHK